MAGRGERRRRVLGNRPVYHTRARPPTGEFSRRMWRFFSCNRREKCKRVTRESRESARMKIILLALGCTLRWEWSQQLIVVRSCQLKIIRADSRDSRFVFQFAFSDLRISTSAIKIARRKIARAPRIRRFVICQLPRATHFVVSHKCTARLAEFILQKVA